MKNSIELLYVLVKQQLILRYRNTVVGYLWTLINPVLMISIMTLVFSTMLNESPIDYAIMLFSGMVPWVFISQSMGQSCNSIVQAEGIIKKIKVKYWLFPAAIVCTNFIDAVLSTIILGCALLVMSKNIGIELIVIPLSFLVTLIASIGAGIIMSVATVALRDLQYITSILLQGLFFITPVFYNKSTDNNLLGSVNEFNPLTYFINVFRKPIYNSEYPSSIDWIVCACSATFLIAIGVLLYAKVKDKLVRLI